MYQWFLSHRNRKMEIIYTVKPLNSGLLCQLEFFHYWGVFHYFDGSFSINDDFGHLGFSTIEGFSTIMTVHYWGVLLYINDVFIDEQTKLLISQCINSLFEPRISQSLSFENESPPRIASSKNCNISGQDISSIDFMDL